MDKQFDGKSLRKPSRIKRAVYVRHRTQDLQEYQHMLQRLISKGRIEGHRLINSSLSAEIIFEAGVPHTYRSSREFTATLHCV